MQGLAELGVRRLVRSESAGVAPLDDEEDPGPESAPAGGDQMLQMDATAHRRRIREEGHAVLHQRHRLHFQETLSPPPRQQEVGPVSAHGRFPAKDSMPPESGNGLAAQAFGHQRIGQVGIGGDVAGRQSHEDQGEPRLATGCDGRIQEHRAAGRQEFVQPARIADVDSLVAPVDLDQRRKPIQAPDESSGNQGPRESNATHRSLSHGPGESPSCHAGQRYLRRSKENSTQGPREVQHRTHERDDSHGYLGYTPTIAGGLEIAVKYLVRARMKAGAEDQVRWVIAEGIVPGAPGYFADHLADCFSQAQRQDDGSVLWIETCYCERYFGEPLAEEKAYMERYFDLGRVKKVIAAKKCSDMNGEEPFKCDTCDCDLPLRRRLTGPSLRDLL